MCIFIILNTCTSIFTCYLFPCHLLQLSELSLQTQCVSLPRTNLPLGSCDHDQLVDHYQVELSQSKQELDSKANELEKLRGELDSLQEEHDGTLRELAKNRNVVEAKESERDLLDQQVEYCFQNFLEDDTQSVTQYFMDDFYVHCMLMPA